MNLHPSFAALLASLAVGSCGASAERELAQQPRDANRQPPAIERPARQERAAVDPAKFAIIISGAGGEETYTRTFTTQALRLHSALTMRLGFAENQVHLLTEPGPSAAEDSVEGGAFPATAKATAAEVRKAFEQVKSAAKPESMVVVFLIGHGSFDAQQAKFNLVGPDLSASDFAGLLDSLPTRKTVFVNCASSSGEFVKPLSASDRIVITATRSGNEQNLTVFAEHLIAALTSPDADADKNGRISVLEAFSYGAKLTADWYKEKDRLATEHALIDDNGDGVGHDQPSAGDGVLAKTTYLDSKPIEQAGTDRGLARLLARREELEQAVEKLKARKAEMKPEEYEAELEKLLLDLARLNQEIKTRPK
jgi:hypothetical protein